MEIYRNPTLTNKYEIEEDTPFKMRLSPLISPSALF